MTQTETLVDLVRTVDVSNIRLPVLRELVRNIQAKSSDQIRRDGQYWTDGDFRQWKEHASHNPW